MPSNPMVSPQKPDTQDRGIRSHIGASSGSWLTWLSIVLMLDVLAVAAFQSPLVRFDRFAIFDSGGELAIQDLIRRGYRPGIDFGYLYGLLPLLVGRIWYGLAGLSTEAFRVEVMVCTMLTVWGMARFAVHGRVGLVGIALIALAIPDLLLVTYIGLVQTLEQTLLVNALAEQVRGRRGTALALLTACCFVKPSLAVLQGLIVVIAIVANLRQTNRSTFICVLGLPALTATIIASLLASVFGMVPLCKTILPRTGIAVYRLAGFGFFHGIGRDFWALPHASLRDYFRYELGFWMLGTLFLTIGAFAGIWRQIRGNVPTDKGNNDEMCATCAGTHLGFVVFIFGHRGTWFYSLPMLILGLAALAARGRWHRIFLCVLIVLLLISDRSKALDILQRWRTDAPTPVTLNLWATDQERVEWAQALELTHGRQPVLFAMCEGGALLIPGFAPPVSGYFVPGNALSVEVRRKTSQLAAASMIISAYPLNWSGFTLWPELKAALDGCELLMEGRHLRVYRRVAPSSVRGEVHQP